MLSSLVLIISPSYNQARYLEQTICSVLFQDYPNIEYIIIEDGSTDDSQEIISCFQECLAFWVSEPEQGQVEEINKANQQAAGDIIA